MTLSSVVPARQALWKRLVRAPEFLRQSIHDPGRVSLRRGLRAALLVPLLLAGASGLRVGPSLATFMVFGAMALLVFADFGGSARSRVRAYFGAALTGIPLIVVGSLASGSVRRPSGATRRDRALAELATELERALKFASEPEPISSSNAIPEAHELRAAVVRALRGSAALLVGSDDVGAIQALVRARDAHRTALDTWASFQLSNGARPEVVLEGLIAAHPLRLMSMVALASAQNAEIVAGLPTTGPAPHRRRDVRSLFVEELTPSSVWLHNSARTALGLAVAVLVARWLAVAYAFWVVLGTLSALRSNASATGRSAVLALVGTAVGVLLAVPFVGITSGQTAWLWIALPVLVFLAAYTPAAVHFVVGQAAFSMLVVVLFNILAPTDWQIGLVRVEDAALGVGVSALVGLLLWPRGARGQLRSALATLYEAGAGSLAASFRSMLSAETEPAEATHAAHDRAHTEVIRAEEVFELFLNERGGQVPSVEVWATLLNGGKGFLVIGEVLDWMAKHGYSAAGTGAPAMTLGSLASEAIANMSRLAEEIRGGRSLRVTVRRDVSIELRSAALASLSGPAVTAVREKLRAVIGLVSTADWLAQLDVLLHDLEAPVAETLADAGRPWWR